MAEQKLVNKLMRRAKYIKKHAGPGSALVKYDRINKLELELRKSPRAFKLMRKPKRRLDSSIDLGLLANKPLLMIQAIATTVARVVFMAGHAIQITLPAGVQSLWGPQVGDVVEFLNGALAGKNLAVVSIVDSTHVNLEDVASFVGPDSNDSVELACSNIKKSYR